MAKGKPAFSPVPFQAINDATLTALDLRVVACIAWHDRLSLWRGGKGCYASNRTMAGEVGCDETSFSRVVSKLVGQGYITREPNPVPGKGRHTIYRVLYEEAPQSRWSRAPSKATTGAAEMDGAADDEFETFSRPTLENSSFQPMDGDKRLLEERKETSIRIETINSEESGAWQEEQDDPELLALERELTSLSAKMRAKQEIDRVYWVDRLAGIEDAGAIAWARLLREQLIRGMTQDERDRALGL